jgi:hypothetical protein
MITDTVRLAAALLNRGIRCWVTSEWEYHEDGEIACGDAVHVQVGDRYAIVNTWDEQSGTMHHGTERGLFEVDQLAADIQAQLALVAMRKP